MLRQSLSPRALQRTDPPVLVRSLSAILCLEFGCSLIAPLEDVPATMDSGTSSGGIPAVVASGGAFTRLAGGNGTSVAGARGAESPAQSTGGTGGTLVEFGGSSANGSPGGGHASGGVSAPASNPDKLPQSDTNTPTSGGGTSATGSTARGGAFSMEGGGASGGSGRDAGGGQAGSSTEAGASGAGGVADDSAAPQLDPQCKDEASHFGMASDVKRCAVPPLWKVTISYESTADWKEEERAALKHALTAWTLAAPSVVSFSELPPNSAVTPRMRFVAGDTCWAPFGQTLADGIQEVSLRGCDEATIQHELGHVLGLVNEQQRADRDRYLLVREREFCAADDSLASRYLFSENVAHCAAEGSPAAQQIVGRYDFDSVMQHPSQGWTGRVCEPASTSGCGFVTRSGHAYVPGATARPLSGGGFSYISPLDGARVIERYHQVFSNWLPFQPIVRADPGPTQPLDTRLADGVRVAGSPAIARWGTSDLIALARGEDEHLYYKVNANSDETWPLGDWEDLGGDFISDPAAVSWREGSLDYVAVKSDGNLHHGWYDHGVWSTHTETLDRPSEEPMSAPAITSWAFNRLDVFVRAGVRLYQKSWLETRWGPWNDISESLAIQGRPSATSWGPNRIDLVVVGTDGLLRHRPYNGSWDTWANHNVTVHPGTSPTVTAPQPDVLDIYFVGEDGHLWLRYWTGLWSSFTDLGGMLEGSPAAFKELNGRAHVLAPVYNGQYEGIWHRYWQPP